MRVYVDMDGVLVDFVGGVAQYCNIKICDIPKHEWDFVPWVAKKKGVGESELFDMFGSKFWSELQPTPECFDLMKYLEKHHVEIRIVSHPWNGASAKGKNEWLQKHFPKIHGKHNYHFMYHKEELARPDRILIDDRPSNIVKWYKEGGKVVQWPTEFNGSDFQSVAAKMSYLYNQYQLLGLENK
jgi:5'(3')-deoxyribonucleotidase